MIAKKNPGVDLERKRMVFFNIGLLTAGAFTLVAFTYTSPLLTEEEKRAVTPTEIVYMAEAEETPKDEPVVQEEQVEPQQTQQQTVGSQTAVTSAVTSTSNTSTGPVAGVGTNGPVGVKFPIRGNVKVDIGKVVEIPEIDATYIGGRSEMLKDMAEVQEYPAIDIELGIQGTVYVSFVVEVDGSLTDIGIARGVSPTLDREAKRIVRSFPDWKPGEDKYGAVRTRVRLPIRFILQG